MVFGRQMWGWAVCVAGCLTLRAAANVAIVAQRADKASATAEVGVLRCWPPRIDPATAAVSVQAEDGRTLGHQVVWWRAGEPLDLRFDCSGGVRRVTVRFGAAAAGAASPWQGKAGVLLETRPRVSEAVESLAAVLAHWEQAGTPLGRSEVERIFDGIHRHGPTANFLSHYEGWFGTPKAGKYGFATMSDDASFLLVDGKSVAAWPGWHNTDGGRHAQQNGWVQLDAGWHRIDYYNVQNDAGFQVAAAWQPPGAEAFTVMPLDAFRPTARFETVSVEGEDAVRTAAAFRWWPGRHVRTDSGTLLGVWFEAQNAVKGDFCRWRFPDGVVREGPSVMHVFCGPGMASVSLEVLRGGQRFGLGSQTVNVRPDWSQTAEFDEGVYTRLMEAMPDVVLGEMTPAALSAWVTWAVRLEDRALLTRLGAACLPKLKEFDPASAEALYRLGFHYQEPALRRHGDARAVWTALLALPDAPPELRGRTALHLGGMTLHTAGDAAAAERLFAEADRLLPAGDDRRLLDIYRGDACALAGRAPEARECYQRAGTVVAADDVHYEVRRVERMERARRYLADNERDAAERVLREIEWERPMERMGLETGLLLAQVHRARGETELAFWTVRRLRGVGAGDPRRPELLWLTARVCRDAGRTADAEAAIADLLKQYPYSEAASWAQAERRAGDAR